jgi:murein DD-endopeptidase MepM/ murein hydrolase activator NlpD
MADRPRWLALTAGLALAAGACAPPPEPAARARRDIALERDAEVIEAKVPRHATLAGLLRAHAVSEDLASRIVEAAREAFDPRRLRADQPYRLERTVDGLVRLFEYKIDADRFLRIVGLDGGGDAPPRFDVEVVAYEKQRGTVSLRGTIDRDHPSLVAAVQAAGEGVLLAMALAEVFAGDIDFNNDLQPGDDFAVVFEKELSDGAFAGYGPILAAEFRNDGRTLKAFRYQPPGGRPGYYDEHGRSLRRFFLRSPLKFEPRISSGFTYRRLHPILGTWRAHPAIDYAAPAGAPVVAVASGVVVQAGWAGGGGRTVTIRHSNGYESSYLHLSAFAPGIRAGVRVAQGEVIGRVGSTGLATGPHLDYRLRKNGQWVNPLVEARKLPPGEPIAAAHRADFDTWRDRIAARFVPTITARSDATAAHEAVTARDRSAPLPAGQ